MRLIGTTLFSLILLSCMSAHAGTPAKNAVPAGSAQQASRSKAPAKEIKQARVAGKGLLHKRTESGNAMPAKVPSGTRARAKTQ